MRYSYLFLVFILFSCGKKNDFLSVKLIGHAGNGLNISSSMYHDNSLNSIQLALSQNGCDGVEIDVQLSKDGTAWLFHDANMKGATNLDACINSSTDAEISSLSYNHFHDERLLQLKDLQVHSKTIFLDLRHYNYCTESIIDINKFILELNLFKLNNPSCEIYALTNYKEWLNPLHVNGFKICYAPVQNEDVTSLVDFNEISSFVFKNDEISATEVKNIKNLGKEIFIFEVRSPKGIREALKKQPSSILTDDLKAASIEKY